MADGTMIFGENWVDQTSSDMANFSLLALSMVASLTNAVLWVLPSNGLWL
jgi:hypothetical protein